MPVTGGAMLCQMVLFCLLQEAPLGRSLRGDPGSPLNRESLENLGEHCRAQPLILTLPEGSPRHFPPQALPEVDRLRGLPSGLFRPRQQAQLPRGVRLPALGRQRLPPLLHVDDALSACPDVLQAAGQRADRFDVGRRHDALRWMSEADPRLPVVEGEEFLVVHVPSPGAVDAVLGGGAHVIPSLSNENRRWDVVHPFG